MAIGDPYITDSELADHLNMSAPTAQMALAVAAASSWVEGYCGRQFNLAETATPRTFDTTVANRLYVDDIGHATITVESDTVGDGTYATTWASTDYQPEPLNAIADGLPIRFLYAVRSEVFPSVVLRRGLVRVTARWGWPAVPSDVKLATLIQAAKLYKRRESPEGVLGGNDFGIVRVGPRDRDVADLLAPYVIVKAGIA